MKRGLIVAGIFLIVILLLAVVSAFSFSEFWKKLFEKNVQLNPPDKVVNITDVNVRGAPCTSDRIFISCTTDQYTSVLEPWWDVPAEYNGWIGGISENNFIFYMTLNQNIDGDYWIGCLLSGERADNDLYIAPSGYEGTAIFYKRYHVNTKPNECSISEKTCSSNSDCTSDGVCYKGVCTKFEQFPKPRDYCDANTSCPTGKTCVRGSCVQDDERFFESVDNCIDSETTLDIYVRGNVTSMYLGYQFPVLSFDYCLGNTNVFEFSCLNSTTKLSEVIPCPSGKRCFYGACYNSDLSICIDTDGINETTGGTGGYTMNFSLYQQDLCLNDSLLNEFYCDNGAVLNISINCPNGYYCRQDRCLKSSWTILPPEEIKKEICDNGIDDNNNRLVDCQEEGCAGQPCGNGGICGSYNPPYPSSCYVGQGQKPIILSPTENQQVISRGDDKVRWKVSLPNPPSIPDPPQLSLTHYIYLRKVGTGTENSNTKWIILWQWTGWGSISDEGNGVYSVPFSSIKDMQCAEFDGKCFITNGVLENGEYEIKLGVTVYGDYQIYRGGTERRQINNSALSDSVRFSYSESSQASSRNILQRAIDKIKEFFS